MTTDDLESGWQHAGLRQTPSWLITQTATLTNRYVTQAFASVDATRHEYSVLMALRENKAATQAELGRQCGIDRSDIAGTVSTLEASHFVERCANPRDRREKIVSITGAGHQRLKVIADALLTAQNELLAGMSATDRMTLSRLLVGILDAHAAGPPHPSQHAP